MKKAATVNIQFNIGSIFSIEFMLLDISINIIKFYIIETDTFFLFYFKNMDKLNVYFNNLKNVLIILIKLVLVVCCFDFTFLL